MIGIVVVTHGRFAEELVNAARTIVGELPNVTAVAVGWSEDTGGANAQIRQAIEAAAGGPLLILTDMFGGTPTNVALPFLSDSVEIVTGVNLPMLIKAAGLREGDLHEVAHRVLEQGQRSIYVAREILEKRT